MIVKHAKSCADALLDDGLSKEGKVVPFVFFVNGLSQREQLNKYNC